MPHDIQYATRHSSLLPPTPPYYLILYSHHVYIRRYIHPHFSRPQLLQPTDRPTGPRQPTLHAPTSALASRAHRVCATFIRCKPRRLFFFCLVCQATSFASPSPANPQYSYPLMQARIHYVGWVGVSHANEQIAPPSFSLSLSLSLRICCFGATFTYLQVPTYPTRLLSALYSRPLLNTPAAIASHLNSISEFIRISSSLLLLLLSCTTSPIPSSPPPFCPSHSPSHALPLHARHALGADPQKPHHTCHGAATIPPSHARPCRMCAVRTVRAIARRLQDPRHGFF